MLCNGGMGLRGQKSNSINLEKMQSFCSYVQNHLAGREKGEGQIFFDRLLQAFGNAGVKEVGASCEERIKKTPSSHRWADFIWPHRVLIELKKRGEKLEKHYDQLFENWCFTLPRVKYAALCNFDTLWVYDFNQQLYDPVDKMRLNELPTKHRALAFLYPKEEEPIFGYNYNQITEAMAQTVGKIYKSLIRLETVDAAKAQRFVLQLVVALFAEDAGLIQERTMYKILKKVVDNPDAQADITREALKQLFLSMSIKNMSKKKTEFANIPFFNGGIFKKVETFELSTYEWQKIYEASKQNWRYIRPSIFGSIFEASTDKDFRHGHGLHYTSELDIQKIVEPTITRPFKEKIHRAKEKKQLRSILQSIRNFKVLDPACGS